MWCDANSKSFRTPLDASSRGRRDTLQAPRSIGAGVLTRHLQRQSQRKEHLGHLVRRDMASATSEAAQVAPTSLQTALLNKYASPDSFNPAFLLDIPARSFGSKRQPPARLLARQKEKDSTREGAAGTPKLSSSSLLQKLQSASLPGESICRIDPEPCLGVLLPRLRSLDLQGNALALADAYTILSSCAALQTLDLGRNALGGPVPDVEPPALLHLATLAMNHTGISQEATLHLLTHAEHLTALHVGGNGWTSLSALSEAGQHMPALTHLHLASSPLTSLLDTIAQAAAAWPSLRHLDLAASTFSARCLPASTAGADSHGTAITLSPPLIGSLTSLCADDCDVQTWAEVDFLGQLPLACIRLQRIPALQPVVHGAAQAPSPDGDADAGQACRGTRGLWMDRAALCGAKPAEQALRQLVLARLPHCTSLNGSAVAESERSAAERFALRYTSQWAADSAPGLPHAMTCAMAAPLRQPEWVAAHGELGPLAAVDMSAPAPVHFEVRFGWESGGQEQAPLPTTSVVAVETGQTIGEVKGALLGRLPQELQALPCRLMYLDVAAAAVYGEQELSMDSMLLSSHRPCDGDVLTVLLQGP